MTGEQFIDAMNGIDPALIERADKAKKRKSPVFKLAAIAAVLALTVGAVWAILPAFTGVPMTEDKIVWKNIFDPERWDPMGIFWADGQSSILRQNYDYDDPQYEKPMHGGVVKEEIGEMIGQTEVHAWITEENGDEHTDFGKCRVEFYEIVGIPRELAIAYKYVDYKENTFFDRDGEYRYMCNGEYEFRSLSELYGYFGNMSVSVLGDVVRYERSSVFKWSFNKTDIYMNRQWTIWDGSPADHVPEILLSAEGSVNVESMYNAFDSELLADMTEYLKIVVGVPMFGAKAVYYITDNGYVVIEFTDKMYFVNVGAEKTAQMVRDITGPMELYVPPEPGKNKDNSDKDKTADETAVAPSAEKSIGE